MRIRETHKFGIRDNYLNGKTHLLFKSKNENTILDFFKQKCFINTPRQFMILEKLRKPTNDQIKLIPKTIF